MEIKVHQLLQIKLIFQDQIIAKKKDDVTAENENKYNINTETDIKTESKTETNIILGADNNQKTNTENEMNVETPDVNIKTTSEKTEKR